MNYLVIGLYIIAFALFIYGLMGLTGPKTAVRGNLIAAVGMAIAVAATLVKIGHTGQWVLIIAGLVVGVVLGVPPARLTKMTAMPQLVAFFNGVGGGTVALIALSEFIETTGFSAFQHGETPTVHIVVASLFAAIIGSISFWGSIIAFGKLQEIISGSPIGFGKAQQPINVLLLAAAVAAAVVIGLHAHPGTGGVPLWWMIGLLAAAGVLGLMVVLPIGGADMPVVISMLNAMTGLSAAAAGLALNNTAMIVAGMIVGASGSILTNLMAKAMNRSIPAIVAGGFGGGGVAPSGDGGGDKQVKVHFGRRRGDSDGVRQPGDRGTRLRHGRRAGPARRQGHGHPAGGPGRASEIRDPPGGGPDARAHERAAGRGRGRLRRDEGHGRHQ